MSVLCVWLITLKLYNKYHNTEAKTPLLWSYQIKSYGSVIEIKFNMIDKYNQLHADVCPDVLKANTVSHIRNYSIYLRKVSDK